MKKVEELKKFKGYEEDEIAIAKWLQARKGQAYTYIEINKAIKGDIPINPDEKGSYWNWENVGVFTLNVLALSLFRDTLKKMVEAGKIKMIPEHGEEYYYYE